MRNAPQLMERALVAEPHDELADRILDAAVAEAGAVGVRRLSLEDVARRAGTTRVTVYRRFGGREQVIDAMAVRETRRFIDALAREIAPGQDIAEQGTQAFLSGLRFMREHPMARRAMESEPQAILGWLQADDGRLLEMARAFVADGLRGAGVGHPRLDAAAETLVRVFVSFLLLPRSVVAVDDEADVRAYVRACLVPVAGG